MQKKLFLFLGCALSLTSVLNAATQNFEALSTIFSLMKPSQVMVEGGSGAVRAVSYVHPFMNDPVPDPAAEVIPTRVVLKEGFQCPGSGQNSLLLTPYTKCTEQTALRIFVEKALGREVSLEAHPDGYLAALESGQSFVFVQKEGGGWHLRATADPVYPTPRIIFQRPFFERMMAHPKVLPLVAQFLSRVGKEAYLRRLQALNDVSLVDDAIDGRTAIPRVIHTILMRPLSPVEVGYFEKTLRTLNRGWQHHVWAADEGFVPAVLRDRVILHDLSEVGAVQGCANFFESSCLLRYRIINQFGGWYRSPDVEVVQDLTRFSKYPFVGAMDSLIKPMVTLSLFGAVPNHRILAATLSLVQPSAQTFGKLTPYVTHGLVPFSDAVAREGVPGQDLILSDTTVLTFLSSQPTKSFDDPKFKAGFETLAIHYSTGDWRK